MDFFNHISYVRKNGIDKVYETSDMATFPPLIYFMYYFFSLILPKNATVMYDPASTSPYALLLYVWYCSVVTTVLAVTVIKVTKGKMNSQLLLIAVILTSNIFVFNVLERGNSVILVCILLIWAVMWKDSENKIKREFALIFIAVAAAFKIYPAIFGILYLFEKRWRDAAHLVVYGVVFFFLPFFFFDDWSPMMGQFLINQFTIQDQSYYGMNCITSLYNLIAKICDFKRRGLTSVTLTAVYALLSVVGVYGHRSLWKKMYLLTSMMILIPIWSATYTLIYLVIPLIFFFFDPETKPRKTNYVYSVMFAFIFAMIALKGKILDNPPSYYLEYIPVYVIDIMLIADGIRAALINIIAKNDNMAQNIQNQGKN